MIRCQSLRFAKLISTIRATLHHNYIIYLIFFEPTGQAYFMKNMFAIANNNQITTLNFINTNRTYNLPIFPTLQRIDRHLHANFLQNIQPTNRKISLNLFLRQFITHKYIFSINSNPSDPDIVYADRNHQNQNNKQTHTYNDKR